jgi:uncharacterized membrane protein
MVLFLGVHLVPTRPGLRNALASRLGDNGYKGAFSLVSLLGLALIIWGKSLAPYCHVFTPPAWGRHATMGLMLLSCIGLAAIYLPTNLKRLTAHPLLWSTVFWGAGHLLANGDLASVLLFGGFLAFALLDIWSANSRGALAQTKPQSILRDAVVLALGLVLYAGLLVVHPHAFGVAVLH